MITKEIGMELTLQTRILEKKIDEGARTVVAGILEGDSLSANKRFYPMSVVESVKDSLVGLKSMIGHDTDSPEDVVATIVNSAMSGKKLFGSFKFGTDEKSDMMFTKIKEGLIDSVSIRASGETRPGKINNEDVDIVDSLKIWSVDLVVEGGVQSAKVMRVYEQAPTIVYDNNKENEMTEEQKKQLEMAESNAKKLKEVGEANAKLVSEKEALESEKKKAEIESYRNEKLSLVEDKEIRDKISSLLTGDSKESIDSQFSKAKELVESLAKKYGSKIVMEPVKENEDEDFKSLDAMFESKKVDRKDKIEALKSLIG